MVGRPTYYGSGLSEDAVDELDLDGIGGLLALTPTNEVNTLAAMHFAEVFGREQIYQLASQVSDTARTEVSAQNRGRALFGKEINHARLEIVFARGWSIKKTKLTKEFDSGDYQDLYPDGSIPLCWISESKELVFYTADKYPEPKPGQTLIAVIPERSDAMVRQQSELSDQLAR